MNLRYEMVGNRPFPHVVQRAASLSQRLALPVVAGVIVVVGEEAGVAPAAALDNDKWEVVEIEARTDEHSGRVAPEQYWCQPRTFPFLTRILEWRHACQNRTKC